MKSDEQLAYAEWRFAYYMAHGGMTYAEIDALVACGLIKIGSMP